jgi:hypothetical protein
MPRELEEGEAWFRYTRTAGRLTAAPVNLKGWLVLLAAILFPLLVTLAFAPAAMRVHPLLFAAVLVASIGASFFLLIRILVAKGRPGS